MVNMLRKDALKFQLELGNYSHISIFCAEGTQPGYSYYENFFVFIYHLRVRESMIRDYFEIKLHFINTEIKHTRFIKINIKNLCK